MDLCVEVRSYLLLCQEKREASQVPEDQSRSTPALCPQLSHPTYLPHLPVTGTLKEKKGLLIHSETWDISQTLSNILISSLHSPCWRRLLRQECFWSNTKKITLVGNNGGETWWSRRSELVLPSETPTEKRKVSELPQSNSSLHGAPLTSLNKERWEMCFWFQSLFPNFVYLLYFHLHF